MTLDDTQTQVGGTSPTYHVTNKKMKGGGVTAKRIIYRCLRYDSGLTPDGCCG